MAVSLLMAGGQGHFRPRIPIWQNKEFWNVPIETYLFSCWHALAPCFSFLAPAFGLNHGCKDRAVDEPPGPIGHVEYCSRNALPIFRKPLGQGATPARRLDRPARSQCCTVNRAIKPCRIQTAFRTQGILDIEGRARRLRGLCADQCAQDCFEQGHFKPSKLLRPWAHGIEPSRRACGENPGMATMCSTIFTTDVKPVPVGARELSQDPSPPTMAAAGCGVTAQDRRAP